MLPASAAMSSPRLEGAFGAKKDPNSTGYLLPLPFSIHNSSSRRVNWARRALAPAQLDVLLVESDGSSSSASLWVLLH
jgi:hypothetical protein